MYESDETMEGALQMGASETAPKALPEEKTDAPLDRGEGVEEATPTAEDDPYPAAAPEAVAQSFDPDPEADAADPQPAWELERLRGELNQIKRDMEAQRRAFERMGAECAEFCELYPDRSPSDLPDEVWESMRRGVPLAAAYALYERRRARIEEAARLQDEKNRSRSTGGVETAKGGYLSPDEVRSMTPAEVRANYQSIMLSMQKWR